MRSIFLPEHELFRDSLKRFIASDLEPHRSEWEKTGLVPRGVWLKAGAAGFLCCNIPESYGGHGSDFLYNAVVVEEMAKVGGGAPPFYLQSDMAAPYLLHFGTEEQKLRWLPKLVTGEVLASIAMTEPVAGSDLQGIRTTAIRDGDHFIVNGQKTFITNAAQADLYIVACKTIKEARGRGISLLMIDRNAPGVTCGQVLEKLGNKAHGTAEIFFDNVCVPASNLLGSENNGLSQLAAVLAQERLVQAVRGIAVAEEALSWTIAHVKDRVLFKRRLSDFQNTQFKLAELAAEIGMHRVYIDHCLSLHLAGNLDSVEAAKAKLLGTELQGKVVDTCLQFFGGYGFMWAYPITRAYADARVTRISGGASEIMKSIIAKQLLS